MRSAIHALSWGLQRVALVLAIIVFVPLFLYAVLVAAIVTGQAYEALGQ